MKVKTKVTLFSILLLFSACNKENSNKIPVCIKEMIEGIKSENVWNPPAEIWRYKYNGQTVYYILPRCCDIPSILLDENCNTVCSPDGGITGRGDGSCSDFFDRRSDEKLIWKDKRSYP